MNRLERISAILVKLQSRPVVTASEIAEQFGVSLRTVYRDIRALEESGIPVGGEAGVGYSLVDGFKLPPLMFNTEEALSFLVAEKLVSHQTDGDTYGLFRSGMDKIRAVLKTAEKDILHHFDQYIRISGSYSAPPAIPGNVLQPLLKGLLNKKQLLMTYRAGYNHQVTERTVEPQGMFFSRGIWYVLAWCKLRRDYRTFHLGRIVHLSLTENDFEEAHPPLNELIEQVYYSEVDIEVKLMSTAMSHAIWKSPSTLTDFTTSNPTESITSRNTRPIRSKHSVAGISPLPTAPRLSGRPNSKRSSGS